MTGIRADRSEPDDILRFIDQAVPVTREQLNGEMTRWGDYVWSGESVTHWPDHDGTYQTERKTWVDLAGNIEEIEEQLRAQQLAHPQSYHRLLVEGAGEPAINGIYAYSRVPGRSVMAPKTLGHAGQFKSVIGKLAGWNEFIEIWFTASYPATAATIVELYQRDQKPEDERDTFRKHFKQITWHPNPQVARLVGMAWRDTNIGVEKAEQLIAKFGTAWAVCNARPDEIAQIKGISLAGAKLFLQKIGRLDV